LLILTGTCAVSVQAQGPAAPLVTKAIDDAQVVALHGNVHPLAQARYDQGAVPDSFAAERLLLLLNRPAERETELRQFLRDAHTPGSASYHQWLTPQQFGERFGPADTDIQAAVGWLKSHGFSVTRVTMSKGLVEFSGTAGQLREAFHTQIHQYSIEGKSHYANANELSIPAALAPLVRGISPLNNFRAQPYLEVAGPALYSPATKKTTPLWTAPNQFGTANPYEYLVAPEDFATQYDLAPLYQAGVNGTGQTIGIINESNIDISLVNTYRQLFNLPGNPPQVVIDGDDPGALEGVDTEAYLDVEVSGGVAPNATVNLYISNGSDLQDSLTLAALRAIEDNQASVLSVSFGECEGFLGTAGNQLWAGLWEQAAAQGQTVLVATGDSGPECVLPSLGVLSVSGLASTPWNVAVGGTDFYYSDYASGTASATTLWNQTNDSNLGSLKAPLPEQVWNDPLGLDAISDGIERNEIYAGGGGASNCNTLSSSTGDCVSGYAKPSWQTGPGVPADGARDLPDVSLFASNGANLSAYPICAYEGECAVGAGGEAEIFLTGGTSASVQAMAGIMALVDQKYGRQGQADFTLYPLVQQKPAAFHDITLGSNDVPCYPGTPYCAMSASGVYATTLYPAGPNYDLASGLGSVDASVLVNNWDSVTFLPTTTTLHLSATSITHGTPVTVTTSVAPESGSGTPTGEVAILTDSPLPASQGQGFITLSGGTGSQTMNFFPGGTYQVTGQYSGDGVYGVSTSSPVTLSVTPENSNINFALAGLNGNVINGLNGNTGYYGQPVFLSIQPTGASAATGTTNGKATGSATFTLDSTTATLPLNAMGVASWTAPNLAVGTHTASATYAGDASFHASSASPITFSVVKGVPGINDYLNAPFSNSAPAVDINAGGSLTVTIVVGPSYGEFYSGLPSPLGTVAPTGTVTVCLVTITHLGHPCYQAIYSQTATLSPPPSGSNSQYSPVTVTFPNLAAAYYNLAAIYNGDTNWQTWGLQDPTTIYVSSSSFLAASTTTLSVTPASISGTQLATVTTTVTGTGNSGIAPTGWVYYYNNGIFITYAQLTPGNTGATSSLTFQLNTSYFWNSGANQVTAIYQGDSHYQPSTSNVANFTVTQSGGDFMMTPQRSQITVQSGSSGTVGVNLTSLSNFSGIVTLTCTPSSSNISCSVNPASPMLNGAATATVTINATAQAAALDLPRENRRAGWLVAAGGLICAFVLLGGLPDDKRKRRRLLRLGLCTALWFAMSCGGGDPMQPTAHSSSNSNSSSSPTGTYSVVVSGTANGIIHNAKVIVAVR
jgi:subtilase family serine protease